MALILLLSPISSARAEDEMTFETVNYGGESVISATGHISERTPEMFLDFLQKNSRSGVHAVVFLDSPGGIVLASMEFGTLLRKIGAAAVVAKISSGFLGAKASVTPAKCLSACVYALIGARKRVIPPESEVGIHKMFLTVDGADVTALSTKQDRATASGLRGLLSSYTGKMGVSPELIARAEKIPSEELHILTRAEIKKWRLGVPNL
ncbi:MAG: hypothetical protein ABSA13_13075 [Beijerinckiaceae bacterium]|jgi:hypothetical protein